jgi:hypothetical protein
MNVHAGVAVTLQCLTSDVSLWGDRPHVFSTHRITCMTMFRYFYRLRSQQENQKLFNTMFHTATVSLIVSIIEIESSRGDLALCNGKINVLCRLSLITAIDGRKG